jgi:hypothetical protein
VQAGDHDQVERPHSQGGHGSSRGVQLGWAGLGWAGLALPGGCAGHATAASLATGLRGPVAEDAPWACAARRHRLHPPPKRPIAATAQRRSLSGARPGRRCCGAGHGHDGGQGGAHHRRQPAHQGRRRGEQGDQGDRRGRRARERPRALPAREGRQDLRVWQQLQQGTICQRRAGPAAPAGVLASRILLVHGLRLPVPPTGQVSGSWHAAWAADQRRSGGWHPPAARAVSPSSMLPCGAVKVGRLDVGPAPAARQAAPLPAPGTCRPPPPSPTPRPPAPLPRPSQRSLTRWRTRPDWCCAPPATPPPPSSTTSEGLLPPRCCPDTAWPGAKAGPPGSCCSGADAAPP